MPKNPSPQPCRTFSESFRKARVADIDNGLLTVAETIRMYGMSKSVLYRWKQRYSQHYQHQTRQVVELESEQHRTKVLLDRVAVLERTIGQKQIEIDMLRKCLDLAGEEFGEEWKKKLSSALSPGSIDIATLTTTP